MFPVSRKDSNYKHPEERRQMLVKEILKKVTNISLNAFLNTTLEERPQVLKIIRKKLKTASKLTGSHGNKYVELVMDGIQSFMTSNNPGVIKAKKTRPFDSNTQHLHEYGDKPRTADTENRDLSDELGPADEAIAYRDDDVCDCSCVERKMCSKVWSLGKFTCFRDQNQISIEKLCDGEYDCKDNSDEDNCTLHANKKLLDAKQIVKEIENILPKRCLEVQISSDKVVVKTQEKVLAHILKKQQTFLNVFSPIKSDKSKEKPIKEVNEIALVVSTAASALEGALCIRERYKNLFSRRDGTQLDENVNVIEHKPRSWVPPLCTCVDQFCLQNNCTPACNNTCWQRYTFGRWVCHAIGGAQSVSINLICDGKVDCFDESDEDGCTTGVRADKFEATQMYDNILQVLATKTGSTEFHSQLSKFIKLQEAIRSLQKVSMTEQTDESSVKRWRDEAFSELLSIYEGTLAKANDITVVDVVYDFLISVNNKLVDAMKRSKTGNERLVSSDECQCIGDKCLFADCSSACVRSCAVQAIFTEYSCKGDSHARIPIQDICNGKIDCPDRDDEENCKTDICRNHHLVLLRHNIQNHKAGLANALTEILNVWKEKTISTVSVLERGNRKNHHDLQKLVFQTLHDLVRAYASLPKLTRRNTDITTAAFLDLARLVQDTLRECTK